VVPLGRFQVGFPVVPYPQQVDYMRALLEALDKGENALLESPTGTGKTLALLCASLEWQKRKGNHAPRIFYTSRTHTQLQQAVREVKRTQYNAKTAVYVMKFKLNFIILYFRLSSRTHSCLHKEISQYTGSKQIQECKKAQSSGTCTYYNNLLGMLAILL
jgi:regulator of telomere elongation helicase 1